MVNDFTQEQERSKAGSSEFGSTREALHRDAYSGIDTARQILTDANASQLSSKNTALDFLPSIIFDMQPDANGEATSSQIHPADRPRVGMAWNGATNLPEQPIDSMARHDIVIGSPATFKLKADNEYPGLATSFTPESVNQGDEMHQQLINKNPDITTLAEIRYRDAKSNYLPADSPWWQRNKEGQIVEGYAGAGPSYQMLDIRNSNFQDQVAEQSAALIATGAANGVMLDWFNDGVHKGEDWDKARLQMLQKIRKSVDEVNPGAQIFINTNAESVPDDEAKLVNGYYMECNKSTSKEDWNKITTAVDRAEKQGKIPFVETWFDPNMSRDEENKMRATMALVMTHAPDGVALFGDPDGLKQKEHQHDFYQFYETKIGKPTGPEVSIDGTSQRDFENGRFVYNPIGNGGQTIRFNEPRTSAATGQRGTEFVVPAEDGDFFSK